MGCSPSCPAPCRGLLLPTAADRTPPSPSLCSQVPNLTLVDLPGLTKIPIDGRVPDPGLWSPFGWEGAPFRVARRRALAARNP